MDGVDLDGSWGTTNLNPWRDQYLSMGGSIDGITSNPYGACFRDDINQVLAGPVEICSNAQQRMPDWGPNGITDYKILNNDSYNTDGNVSALVLSDNLVDWQDWTGVVYGNDPGGCCSSISGSGAMIDNATQTILFSYGRDILSQTFAINQALAQSGVSVDGYNYGWSYKLVSKNSSGDSSDTLIFEVEVTDANGNVINTYSYDRSGISDDVWKTESGLEIFNSAVQNPNTATMRIIGQDGGFWGGYYGPEVKDVMLKFIYRADPCAADPLYDPSCSGYAEAYAEQQYQLNCQSDPLYDSGCPGYQQAYYDQQCNANPLYDQGCPNYAQAYYDQQCSIDPLYDMGCTGYAEAYHDYQCSLDAFYDTTCDGYAEAYAKEYILTDDTTDTTDTVSSSTVISSVADPVESLTSTPVTGDSTIDSILGDLNEIPTTSMVMETSTVETSSSESATGETESQEQVGEELVSVEQEINENSETETESSAESESSEDSDNNESGGENAEGEDSSDKDESGSKDKDDKKESKREKLKKAVTKKAMQLADNMSNAASLEAQQAVQAQVLALINYVPDFDKYNRTINGGYLPDAYGYPDTTVPESKRGLRNGLAQQLLHEKMVDMQYE